MSHLAIQRLNGARSAAQHGFYARPRLRPWSMVCFTESFAPLSRFGLPRRGHRLFGNVIPFGKLFGVATLVGFGEKRCRKNLPLCVIGSND